MKLYFFLITSLSILSVNAQQVLNFKNGNSMNGKIEKVVGDTIIFKFQGNRIKVHSSEISAIYFDPQVLENEKKKNSQVEIKEGKISGIVTYFFNKNFGDKVDVGSTVYFLDSIAANEFVSKDSSVHGINFKAIQDYLHGDLYRNLKASYLNLRMDIPKEISEEIINYGVETDEKYNELGELAMINYIRFTIIAEKVTVDGNGSYSKSLKPGTYYIAIESKHRQHINKVESMGAVELKTIHIKSGEEIETSHNFTVN